MVRAQAKTKPKTKVKAKARERARAKEKEKERANAAKATLLLRNPKAKSGPRQSGRHGMPSPALPVERPPTVHPSSPSKKESGAKTTPRTENAKVAT